MSYIIKDSRVSCTLTDFLSISRFSWVDPWSQVCQQEITTTSHRRNTFENAKSPEICE